MLASIRSQRATIPLKEVIQSHCNPPVQDRLPLPNRLPIEGKHTRAEVRILPLEPNFKSLTTSDFSSWQDRFGEKCQQICQQSDRRMYNSHGLCHHSATTL